MSKLNEIINKYLEEHDLTLREFAKKCGLSHSYIAKLRKGENPRSKSQIEPTIDTMKKLAKAMNMNLKELLIKSEYIEKNTIQAQDNTQKNTKKLIDEIIQILIDTGEITPEEIRSGKLSDEKRERLIKLVKAAIEFSRKIEK